MSKCYSEQIISMGDIKEKHTIFCLKSIVGKISTWCNLWGMRLNPNKTQSIIVSRSRTVFPPHPDLFEGSTSLSSCEFFIFLGVTFDSKFTFERHI